jgi:hypothetical protein
MLVEFFSKVLVQHFMKNVSQLLADFFKKSVLTFSFEDHDVVGLGK